MPVFLPALFALAQPPFLFPIDMLENDMETQSLPFALCDSPQPFTKHVTSTSEHAVF